MNVGEITRERLDWAEFDRLCGALAAGARALGPFDLVVGIARGGLPVAVALSHRLACRAFSAVVVERTVSEAAFSIGEATLISEFAALPREARRVLVVDDIAATGRTFTRIGEAVRRRWGADASCAYAALYADRAAFRRTGHVDALARLVCARDIDNAMVWVEFPWEATP